MKWMARVSLVLATAFTILVFVLVPVASAQQKKPNILIIMGDDIGYWNVSANSHGMMGYRTPNIDRIAKEGANFTDLYAQQSCTAGRAAFITGQSPFRTGLLKVGLPAAKEGLSEKDPTIADLLKPLGYATGQFGKTTSATVMTFFRQSTGLTSSLAISTTSMRKTSQRTPTTPKLPGSRRCSARVVC
jgi:hypothetical protein